LNYKIGTCVRIERGIHPWLLRGNGVRALRYTRLGETVSQTNAGHPGDRVVPHDAQFPFTSVNADPESAMSRSGLPVNHKITETI
jgi:hypothetical protein